MGRRGDLLVYFRRDARFDDNKGWMDLVRIDFDVPLTPSPDGDPLDPPFRWTKALLGNEWVVSRSAPAAALHGDDVALSFRWYAQDIQNMVLLQLAASGIVEKDLTDFDDLAHIASVGLREPLRRSSW